MEIIDLKKEFANFKEKLIKGAINIDTENFDEMGFLNFITGFYFPLLVNMAGFWSQTGAAQPGQFLTCCYGCLDATTKLTTKKGNLKDIIDEVVLQSNYQDLLDHLLAGLQHKN